MSPPDSLGSKRTMRAVRQWLPGIERTIEVTLGLNSHTVTRTYTVDEDERNAIFVRMRPTVGGEADDPVEVWWGVVATIDWGAETFVAELYPAGRQEDNVRFSTEFRLAQVAPVDRDRLAEGAIFTW